LTSHPAFAKPASAGEGRPGGAALRLIAYGRRAGAPPVPTTRPCQELADDRKAWRAAAIRSKGISPCCENANIGVF
jgi:hypothetical protein